MLRRRIDNPRYPHVVRVVRMAAVPSVNPYKDAEGEEVVLYEGKGRSYTDTTTTGDKKVDYNKRKALIPLRFDEWETDAYPQDGDRIEVEIGQIKEEGLVKDFEADNGRSIVYWQFTRN